MIVEIGNGKDGLKDYLETGKKKGRELHRNELDQRIPLFGDLSAFELATSIHGGDGTKYNHITLSFTESHVSDEMLQTAVNEFREHALSAWPESERHRIAFYAEAHRPRLMRYVDAEKGTDVVRLTHIHIGLGRHDLADGKVIDVLGYLGRSENLKYIDAWQESFNSKYGFSSPKDNPKITPENAIDVLARYTGHKPDALGNFNEKKSALELELQKSILAENVTSWDGFGNLLAKYGTVSKVNEGKFGECYRIKPVGSERAMRLKGIFFQRDFIERSTSDKAALIENKARVAYLEQMQPRKEPVYVANILADWAAVKARENRYLHTGSKFYKEVYLPADADTRFKILNQIESKNNVLPRPLDAHSRKIAPSRGRLPGLPIRGMDGIQRRAEMLLFVDAGVDVPAESIAISDSIELRQADGIERRSPGRIANDKHSSAVGAGNVKSGRAGNGAGQDSNSRLDHVAQPSNVIGRIHADLLDRYERAADKERYAEIRRHLDGAFLLNCLSHTHGVNVELYKVAAAKDGSMRIQCGTRALSPSDFLKLELGLPWKEAAPILRRVYEQQIGKAVTSPRGKAVTSPLWHQFKQGRDAAQIELRERRDAFKLASKARHNALAHASTDEQKRTLSGLKGAARKAARSLAVLHAALLKAELTAALSLERQALRETIYPAQAVAWRLFLQEHAQAGNEEALATLRTLDDTARTRGASITGTIELDDEDQRQRKRRLSTQDSDRSILGALVHAVEQNGDVTYRHNGQAVLRDEGDNISVLDQNSDEAIAAGLLLAREKFGPNLILTGSPEFQRRVVAVAVAQGVPVRFLDPELETIRQQLAVDKVKLPDRPTPPQQQSRVPDLATPEKIAVKAEATAAMPVIHPRQIVAAPARPIVLPQATENRKATPTVTVAPDVEHQPATVATPGPQPVSAHAWARTWAAEERKTIVDATPERGNTTYTVIFVASDGVVVNKGRTGAVYEVPDGLELNAGDKVVIDEDRQLHMYRSPQIGKEKENQR